MNASWNLQKACSQLLRLVSPHIAALRPWALSCGCVYACRNATNHINRLILASICPQTKDPFELNPSPHSLPPSSSDPTLPPGVKHAIQVLWLNLTNFNCNNTDTVSHIPVLCSCSSRAFFSFAQVVSPPPLTVSLLTLQTAVVKIFKTTRCFFFYSVVAAHWSRLHQLLALRLGPVLTANVITK